MTNCTVIFHCIPKRFQDDLGTIITNVDLPEPTYAGPTYDKLYDVQLDYVLVSSDIDVKKVDVDKSRQIQSDHFPVIIDAEVKKGKTKR